MRIDCLLCGASCSTFVRSCSTEPAAVIIGCVPLPAGKPVTRLVTRLPNLCLSCVRRAPPCRRCRSGRGAAVQSNGCACCLPALWRSSKPQGGVDGRPLNRQPSLATTSAAACRRQLPLATRGSCSKSASKTLVQHTPLARVIHYSVSTITSPSSAQRSATAGSHKRRSRARRVRPSRWSSAAAAGAESGAESRPRGASEPLRWRRWRRHRRLGSLSCARTPTRRSSNAS
jgi:hypothetical protein